MNKHLFEDPDEIRDTRENMNELARQPQPQEEPRVREVKTPFDL